MCSCTVFIFRRNWLDPIRIVSFQGKQSARRMAVGKRAKVTRRFERHFDVTIARKRVYDDDSRVRRARRRRDGKRRHSHVVGSKFSHFAVNADYSAVIARALFGIDVDGRRKWRHVLEIVDIKHGVVGNDLNENSDVWLTPRTSATYFYFEFVSADWEFGVVGVEWVDVPANSLEAVLVRAHFARIEYQQWARLDGRRELVFLFTYSWADW